MRAASIRRRCGTRWPAPIQPCPSGGACGRRMGDATAMDLCSVLNDTVPASRPRGVRVGAAERCPCDPGALANDSRRRARRSGAAAARGRHRIAKIGGEMARARSRRSRPPPRHGRPPPRGRGAARGVAARSRAPIAELVRYTDATASRCGGMRSIPLARLRAAPAAARLVRALGDQDRSHSHRRGGGITRALVIAPSSMRARDRRLSPLLVDRDATFGSTHCAPWRHFAIRRCLPRRPSDG